MRSVSAVFTSSNSTGKAYEYFVREGDEPKVDDAIITSMSNVKEKGFNCARVVAVNEVASGMANKSYLLLISFDELRKRAESATDEMKRIKARETALHKLRELAETKALIESLRGSADPEIVALIKTIES